MRKGSKVYFNHNGKEYLAISQGTTQDKQKDRVFVYEKNTAIFERDFYINRVLKQYLNNTLYQNLLKV